MSSLVAFKAGNCMGSDLLVAMPFAYPLALHLEGILSVVKPCSNCRNACAASVFIVRLCDFTAMLVLLHPNGASFSEYVSAPGFAPGPTAALPKNSQSCRLLPSASKQKAQSPMFSPSSLTLPLQQRQLHLQAPHVLPIAVQAPAAGVAGSPYSGTTSGVSALTPCVPTVVTSSPLQQGRLQQSCASQLPSTVSAHAPLQQTCASQLPAIVSSRFTGTACVLPSTIVLRPDNLSRLSVATPTASSTAPLCLVYPQNNVQCVPVLHGHQTHFANFAGQEEPRPASRRPAKEKQRLLHAKDGVEQHAGAEDLCERKEKHWSEFESTLEQQEEERQQRERKQQPPLWRIPSLRDPLAAAAGDFNPIPVSEATLVRHLWKHARAAVEDPTSTPPFSWDPPATEPHPSYWTDMQQQSRGSAQQQPVQHTQGRSTGEYEQQNHHQNMYVHSTHREGAEEESAGAGVRETPGQNSHRDRRRRGSSTAGSRRSHEKGCEGQNDWPTGSRIETAAHRVGEEKMDQSLPVLSTRVGRSQSPSYVCPRRDDFTAEQLIDAPAYTTNYLGLLSDTGMHYTKRYELPTLSRFLQAKHPVFLRARTSADERQQQSRLSSRDVDRVRTLRASAYRRQRGRQGDKEAESSEKENGHAATAGVISYLIPAVAPVAASAAIIQPQIHPQADQDPFIVPATPAPTVAVSLPPRAGTVTFAQQDHSQVTPVAAQLRTTSIHTSTAAPVATAASESSLTSAALPLCVVPQTTTTSVTSGIQSNVGSPGPLRYPVADGASLAATLPATSLYAHATVERQNLAQVGVESTPATCSLNPFICSSVQFPQTAVFAMAPPPAPLSSEAATPALTYAASGVNAHLPVPGGSAATCASPGRHEANFSDAGIGNTVEHTGGTDMPGQSQEEAQRQTNKRPEDEKHVECEIQSHQELKKQHQEIYEQPGGTATPISQAEQPEAREEPLRQQHNSQPFSQGYPSHQPDLCTQYSPKTCVVQSGPQGTGERETSTHETEMHPTYLLTLAQSHILVPPVAVAVPDVPPVSLTTALPCGENTLAVGEAKPPAVVPHVVSEADSLPAVDGVVGTTQLPAGCPDGAATPFPTPDVSSGPEIAHRVTLLPPGSNTVPIPTTSTVVRAMAPPERCSEPSSRQWRPSLSVMGASPNTCLSLPVPPSTPAAGPVAHLLLQGQHWQPQMPVPALARSGQFVW